MKLTPYERKTLEVLRDNGPTMRASAVGELLFSEPQENRKPHPSPQGWALAAGRFLRPLMKAGLVSQYQGWSITQRGRDAIV